MAQNILKFLTISLLTFFNPAHAQEVWRENFTLSGKGIWGDVSGIVQNDFTGISTWALEYNNIELSNADDYAKTVSTSGGRFEVCDIDGEVIWRSEWINISEFDTLNIQLNANETGNGANDETKYLLV